ncbi:MAG: M24 family metallopeptidase [Streptosporangiales bacterium]|nr:M24 family metallopeptidase [Streptosporangiales bacterium]
MSTRTSYFPVDQRLEQVREATARVGIGALLVSPSSDLRYLTGYAAVPLERLTCLVVPAEGKPRLVVPRLEQPAAEASPAGGSGLDIIGWDETDDPYAVVASLLSPRVETVAVDNHMWAEKVLRLQEAMPNVTQLLAGEVLGPMRIVKSGEEVAALREAGAAIDRVHARMGEWLVAGRTERAVGADIEAAILAEGHERVDFVIVGSGPNGASPHHEVSDRVIADGDAVVVDIGGTMPSGYCSDCTRTYAVGRPPAEFGECYAVLRDAQEAACAAVRPGVTAESVDAAARNIIADAGYGDYFIHRTGHGIGLDTHELPYLVAGNDLALEPGMVFSVEPGIYLPGKHGARIEDIVVVTEDGGERLNEVGRDLVLLPE